MPKNEWIEVEFRGLDKAIHTIEKIKSNIENEMDRIMLRAAEILEAEIKNVITNINAETYDKEKKRGNLIITGTLRASVHSFVRKQFGFVDGVAGTNMLYAPFLEFGTGRRGAASNYPDLPSDYHYGDSAGIQAFKYMHIAWENKKDLIIEYVRCEFGKLVSVNAQIAATFRG